MRDISHVKLQLRKVQRRLSDWWPLISSAVAGPRRKVNDQTECGEGGQSDPRPWGDIIHVRTNHPHAANTDLLLRDLSALHYTGWSGGSRYHFYTSPRQQADIPLLTVCLSLWSAQIIINRLFSSFPENYFFFLSGIFNGQYRGFTITVWRSNNISS